MKKRAVALLLIIVLAVCMLFLQSCEKNDNKIEKIWEIEEKSEFLTEMYLYLAEKCEYGEKMEALNDKQRVVYITQALEMEVNNGGFSQFFLNFDGAFADELASSFEEIGALKTAEICMRAASIFGEEIPADGDDEEKEEKLSELLNECDFDFYEYEDDLEELNFRFIINNKESFLK